MYQSNEFKPSNEKKSFVLDPIHDDKIEKVISDSIKPTNLVSEEDSSDLLKTLLEKSKPPIAILDLDNTLLHAVPTELFHKKYKDAKSKKIIAESLKNVKLYDMSDKDQSYYLVFERPGLQQFLDFLFSNFTVFVWTAATKDYAAFIIDKILLSKSERKLDYVFVHYHTKKSKKRYGKYHPKELKMLMEHYKVPKLNLSNCFIIDDHPDVKSSQPNLCITAPEWTIFDEDTIELNKDAINDQFLVALTQGLKQYLSEFAANKGKIENPSKIITP